MRRGVSVVLAALLLLSPASARPVAAAADHLFFSVNPAASIASGTLFNVQVVARDSNAVNAVDVGFFGEITLHAAAVGGSDFTAGNVVPASGGVASFSVFLNNAANTYQLTASSPTLTGALSSTFNVTANHLAFPAAVPTVQAGFPFNLTVNARDADNNVAENFTGTVSVNASASGGSNFTGGQASVAAVAGGVTFVGLVLNDAAVGYTITAASTGLTGATSNSFTVTTGQILVADHLFFSLNPVASIASGTLFNVQVVARDSNAVNAVDVGFFGEITLHAAAVGGSDFTAGNVVPASGGVASFSVFLNNAANTYQLTASSPTLTGALSSTFNVTANHLAFPAAVPTVQAGFPFNLTVNARDADNNVAENFTGTVSVNASASGGSNFTGGQASVAAVAGGVTFVGLVLNDAAVGYTITAASTGLTGATSNSFDVTPAPVTLQLIVTTVVPNHQAGTPFAVTVQARDANNNVAENFSGTVHLDATAVGGSNFVGGQKTAAAVAGVASFPGLVLNDAADSYEVVASSLGVFNGVSNTFNVTATHLAVLSINNVRAGDPFDVTVEGRDANNNVAENFSGNVNLDAAATGGSNFNGGTANVAAAGGSATFVGLVLNDAADGYTATAASTGLTSGVSNAFNVTARQLVITTVVPNHQAGTPFGVTVEARDANNAVAENFSGNVSLDAIAPFGSNFVGGNKNVAAAAGTAVFTGLVLNNAADNYRVRAVGSAGLIVGGISNGFNVTATHLAVLSINNVRAGDPFDVTVEGRDANNNVAENFSGNVNLDAAATGGSNFNGGTANVAAAGGSATFVGLVLNDAADGYTATAASTGLTSGVSNAFNVTARQLVITTVVPNHQAGTPFGVTVEARDANNAVAENFSGNVSLDAIAPFGSNFVGGNKNVAAAAGTAVFTGLVLNNAADNYRVRAVGSAGLIVGGISNGFNVTATHLAVLSINNVRAGDPFDVTVEGRDANNNVAENFSGNVNLDAAATGGSNFNGGTANVAAAGGSATFVGLVLNDAADGYTATAASTGLTSGVSNAFNVTARQLVITTVVPNHQAGTPFGVTVEARDANNAVAENFSGNVSLDAIAPFGSNFVGGNKNVAAAAGTAVFTGLVLNNAADNYRVRAVGSAGLIVGGISNGFNVTATHLAVLSINNVRAGDPFDVTVEGRDANNNVAENFSGNVNLDAAATGGSNFNGGTANVAAAGGSATFVGLVLNDAADGYTATAASTGLTSGVSNAFNVTARQLVITTVVPNHQAGTPFGVTVEARDANNAVAENFSGNVSLDAIAPFGSNFVGGNKNVAAAAGTAVFTGLVLNNAADNYRVRAVGSAGLIVGGISNGFNVTATHLAVLSINNVRAGDPFDVTVEGRDANNNVAENFSGNVNLDAAATGGSNFNGGTANVAAAGGSATFVGLVLNDAADGYTATAASTGLTSGVSNAFNVTARQLVITTVVPNHQAGTPFGVTVEARDANNAVAENFSGNVSLDAIAPFGSNFVGGTQVAVAAGGVATFVGLVLDDPADNYEITASSPGLISGVSNTFNVTDHPNMSITDVSVTEGHVGTKNVTFTVTLSRPGALVATVTFATAGASATSGTDFVATSGILTFDVGQTSRTITVAVKGDLLNEADETFHVNLSGASNAILIDAQGTGTIRNDDPVPVIVALPQAAVEGSTSPRTATVTIRILAASGQEVRVDYRTADGTAVDGVGEGGADYTPTSGTLVFAPGQVERAVTVALRNDLVVEADEFCIVRLSSPVNAAILTPLATVTILDDDSPSRQLAALRAQVLALDLAPARRATLLDNLRLHCGSLRQFTLDVARWRGTFIPAADAGALIAAANRLRADIGCAP